MLTSPATRFWWSKNRRMPDTPPLFRLLSQRWRPMARVRSEDQANATRYRRRGPHNWEKAHSAAWNPWLWVK